MLPFVRYIILMVAIYTVLHFIQEQNCIWWTFKSCLLWDVCSLCSLYNDSIDELCLCQCSHVVCQLLIRKGCHQLVAWWTTGTGSGGLVSRWTFIKTVHKTTTSRGCRRLGDQNLHELEQHTATSMQLVQGNEKVHSWALVQVVLCCCISLKLTALIPFLCTIQPYPYR